MLTHDDLREMHFEKERRRMSEVRLPPEGNVAVTPSQLGNYPIAEQTAIASGCIRECTAYLKQLQEFYIAVLSAQNTQLVQVTDNGITGWEYDDTSGILSSVEELTKSISKIIDRLPVGERK